MVGKFFDEHSRAWRYYDRIDTLKRYAFRFELAPEQRSDLNGKIVKEIIPQNCGYKDETPQEIHVNAALITIGGKDEGRRFKVVSLGILDGPVIVLAYQEGYLLNEQGHTIETL